MRIVLYTHTAFFETALSLVGELGRRAEVHLLLEVAPDAWETAGFQVPRRALPEGLVPADAVLRDAFPAPVRDLWRRAASFHLVVHNQRRSLHPDSWRVSREVVRFVERLSPAVFQVDDVDVSPRLALALPHLRRTPVLLAVHDPEPHSGERDWRKGLARWIAYRRARGFVLHSEALRGPFEERYRLRGRPVWTVRLGAYDIFRAWSPAAAEERFPTLLFFGRLSPYKGLEVFYRAVARVAAHVPGLRVVVAGRAVRGYDPPPPPALPLPARVEVYPRYVGNAELAALMSEATLVVCPYLDATQSGIVLTAYAFGVPVVASDVGGLPEYVEDGVTGLLVPPGDAEALAAAMEAVLGDGSLRARLRRGVADAAAARLSWTRSAESLMEIYRELGAPT